jgi:glycerophosphoryl diester phosphodiesterase
MNYAFLLFSFLTFSTFATLAQRIYIPKFDVQGHRGARGLAPENTIPAFIVALDTGVTTIEMDVVITKDSLVVVSHEPWMSNEICLNPYGKPYTQKEEKKYNIYQMGYDAIKLFDCGSKENPKFPQQRKAAGPKPLLRDVIVAVEDHIKSFSRYEVDYNIEIKSTKETDNIMHPTPEVYSDLVYNVIDQYLPWDRIVIQSFDVRVLQYWHQKHPEVRLALLVDNKKTPYDNITALGFDPTIYSPDFNLLSRDKVIYLHKRKIRVIPWTVNEISDMLSLKGMGVDGFITDYPDRARKFKYTLNLQPKGSQ